MKKKLFSIMVAIVVAMNFAGAQGMQATFAYSTFYLPGQDKPYMETYLQFDAWTMHFVQQNNGVYSATAEVTLVARQGDSICYLKKYDLNSPTVATLEELDFSFIDVQRFYLNNGIYDIELSLRDKNAAPETRHAVVSEKVIINYDAEHPSLSSLQPMAEAVPTHNENVLSRNGYDMEPFIGDFYPKQIEQINYYYEIYNINAEIGHKHFLAMAYIEQMETGMRYEDMQTMVRKEGDKLVPIYGSLNIKNLPSGNYNLVVELRNRDNQTMLYKKTSFYRSNPGVKAKEISDFATTFAGKYNEKQLNTYLSALYPISNDQERNVAKELVRRPGLEEKQAFLFHFWTSRNAISPEAEWLKYRERIEYVQANFSYPRTEGYNTDFGRVYLQYGPPDFIRDEKNFVSANRVGTGTYTNVVGRDNDNGSKQGHIYYLPYQLWRYNKLETDLENRVFLFWDEHRSGYYKLLNSNARGEVQEFGWERRLCRNQLQEDAAGEVSEQFNRGY